MYDFSVVVCIYNSDIEKLFLTLNTILFQENCTFEIVIADDGSKTFDEDAIKEYFRKNNFIDYRIVGNLVNYGTVKNCLSGVRVAQGKYIKFISPGDYLYDENTLFKYGEYIKNKEYKVVFGRAAYYSVGDKEITLYQKMNPVDLEPYINKDKKAMFRNYLYYRDYILGAAFICNKEVLLKYLLIIQDKVKYAEDCSYILMVADGIEVGFLDDFMIWYEYGTGISTNKSSFWSEMLYKDNLECFKLVAQRHPNLKECYDLLIKRKNLKTLYLKWESKLHSKYVKLKKRFCGDNFLKNPDVSILKKILLGGGNASN